MVGGYTDRPRSHLERSPDPTVGTRAGHGSTVWILESSRRVIPRRIARGAEGEDGRSSDGFPGRFKGAREGSSLLEIEVRSRDFILTLGDFTLIFIEPKEIHSQQYSCNLK